MKKPKSLIILTALLLLATVIGMVACKPKTDDFQLVKANISYIQKAIYTGENDNYSVKVVVGCKEKEFIADGLVKDVQPFTHITITPKKLDNLDKTFAYKIVGDKGDATGSLIKNVLGVSYGAYVSQGGATLDKIKSIAISVENKQDVIALTNVLVDMISADKALEYAYKAVEATLKESIVSGVFGREVYVKFINDKKNLASEYYWYVSFMKDNGNIVSVLVNPKDGSIITIRK